jgi:hypothetical protein
VVQRMLNHLPNLTDDGSEASRFAAE